MTDFLEFLKNSSLTGALLVVPFIVILYFLFATDDNDAFFFLRNRFLRKKMKKHSFHTMNDMVSHLFTTKKSDWNISDGKLTYYPFKSNRKTRFIFETNRFYEGQHELILFEHKSEKFSITQLKNTEQFRVYNRMDSSTNGVAYITVAKELFTFLFALLGETVVYTTTDSVTSTKTETPKTPEESLQELLAEKETVLANALQNALFWNEQKVDDFYIELVGNKDFKVASLSYQQTVFLIVRLQYGQITFQYENQDSKYFPIFTRLTNEIESYFEQYFKVDNVTKQLSRYELTNATLPELEVNISSLLHDLMQNLEWLNDVNRQKVVHTYPADVEQLLSQKPLSPDAEVDVTNGLKKIYKALKMMEYQVQNEKHRMELKQKKLAESN